jgi:hypothetical protein
MQPARVVLGVRSALPPADGRLRYVRLQQQQRLHANRRARIALRVSLNGVRTRLELEPRDGSGTEV